MMRNFRFLSCLCIVFSTFALHALDTIGFSSSRPERTNDRLKAVTAPPPGKLGYAPIVITNNSYVPADRLYLVGKGESLTSPGAFFLQPDPATGICILVSSATNNSADPHISVRLSQLPSAGPNSYFLYVPQMASGRFYLSVDVPLYMETKSNAQTGYGSINDPSQTTIQDPNYYTLYQAFEFTLDANYDLFVNVTYVDYFSLPMMLSSNSYPSGSLYPTLDNLTVVGFPHSGTRNAVLHDILASLTNNDASSPPQWKNLAIPYYNNPYIVSPPLTYLRILAAKQSIALGTNGIVFRKAAIPQAFFSPIYLENSESGPAPGIDYMEQLYHHYNIPGNQLQFTILPANLPPATYTLKSDASTPLILNLTSTSPQAPTLIRVDLNALSTAALLHGAIGEWVGDGAIIPAIGAPWQTEIAKFLSAIFNVGMLPPPPSVKQPMSSEEKYFAAYRESYFSNPAGFSYYGPWYNLYNRTIHPLLIKTNGFGLGYAYDYDDLLGLAGLLHVNMQTNGVLNPYQPYIELTLGILDTAFPNPTAPFFPYNLIIGPLASGSNPIDIIYSLDPNTPPHHTYSLNDTIHRIDNLCNEFLLRCYKDGSKSTYLTYRVYPRYQLVLPTTTRYNSQDSSLMNGLVFGPETDGQTFKIDVPHTNPFPPDVGNHLPNTSFFLKPASAPIPAPIQKHQPVGAAKIKDRQRKTR